MDSRLEKSKCERETSIGIRNREVKVRSNKQGKTSDNLKARKYGHQKIKARVVRENENS